MTKKSFSTNGMNKEMNKATAMEVLSHKENIVSAAEDDDDENNFNSENEQLKPINLESNSKEERKFNVIKRQSLTLRRGDTDLSIDHSGVQKYLPSFMQFSFADREAEQLYREYYVNEKRSDFKTLIVIVIIVNVILFFLYMLSFHTKKLPQMAVLLVSFVVSLISLIFNFGSNKDSIPPQLWTTIPYIVWSVQIAQIFCDLWMYPLPGLPSDSMSWLILYTYSTYVIFPLRLRYCASLAIATTFLHFIIVEFNSISGVIMLSNQVHLTNSKYLYI